MLEEHFCDAGVPGDTPGAEAAPRGPPWHQPLPSSFLGLNVFWGQVLGEKSWLQPILGGVLIPVLLQHPGPGTSGTLHPGAPFRRPSDKRLWCRAEPLGAPRWVFSPGVGSLSFREEPAAAFLLPSWPRTGKASSFFLSLARSWGVLLGIVSISNLAKEDMSVTQGAPQSPVFTLP